MGPDEEKQLRQVLRMAHQLPEPDWNLFARTTKRFSRAGRYIKPMRFEEFVGQEKKKYRTEQSKTTFEKEAEFRQQQDEEQNKEAKRKEKEAEREAKEKAAQAEKEARKAERQKKTPPAPPPKEAPPSEEAPPPPQEKSTSEDYEVLGLKPTASLKEIRNAYLKKALTHHPDKGGDPEVFKRIQNAYERLTSNK